MALQRVKRRLKAATIADRLATGMFYAAGILLIVLFIAFVGYLLSKGMSRLNLQFITTAPKFMEEGGGIGPQLFNSFYLLILSLMVSVPLGIGAGVYLAEYAKPSRLTDAIRMSLDTLSSLPSIVIGLFGLLVFVNYLGWGFSLASGAMALLVINLPVITRVSEQAISSIPGSIKEGSLALGATHWQTIVRVVLPAALPGILSGVILMSGRIFGEAAALLYTAGMSSPPVDYTNWNPLHFNSPLNPFRPAETLAVYIWKVNSEGLLPDVTEVGNGASAVLLLTVLAFNILARSLGRFIQKKTSGATH
ncbi:MAG TPA: phosphate ABC transporter permease PstA [Firmicutes bacterium]|jgi:phosphate transport system permease protein|nr:phosphate ABC transporter permease PstA [Bacillota bacterium]